MRIDAVIAEEFIEHLVERGAFGQVRCAGLLILHRLRGGNVDDCLGYRVDEVGETGWFRLRKNAGRSSKSHRRADQRATYRHCESATNAAIRPRYVRGFVHRVLLEACDLSILAVFKAYCSSAREAQTIATPSSAAARPTPRSFVGSSRAAAAMRFRIESVKPAISSPSMANTSPIAAPKSRISVRLRRRCLRGGGFRRRRRGG